MRYVASISKKDLGLLGDRDELQPGDRGKVIDMVIARATAEHWIVEDVLSYEEFSAADRSAGRVTLEVDAF